MSRLFKSLIIISILAANITAQTKLPPYSIAPIKEEKFQFLKYALDSNFSDIYNTKADIYNPSFYGIMSLYNTSNTNTITLNPNTGNITVNTITGTASQATNADTADGYHLNQNILTTSTPTFGGALISGSLGVGTVSPECFVEMKASSTFAFASPGYRLFSAHTTQDDKSGIMLGYDTRGGGIIAARTEALGQPLEFWTYDGASWGERVRIDKLGNVGIGTTNPLAKLQIIDATSPTILIGKSAAGTNYGYVRWDTTGNYLQITPDNSSSDLILTGGGLGRNVGIGTTNPTNGVLEVVGQVYFSADCSALSFTDRPGCPESIAEAYDMVNSFDSIGGFKPNKLHKKARIDKKIKIYDKKIKKNIEVTTTERNLTELNSALIEVVKNLQKRIEQLENK